MRLFCRLLKVCLCFFLTLLFTLSIGSSEGKSDSSKKNYIETSKKASVKLEESNLPPPAKGFKWQILTEINAAFQMPMDWYYLQEQQDGQLAYFFSEENIEIDGSFKTGLSVNVIFKIKKKVGKDAVTYARDIIVGMIKNSDTLSTGSSKINTVSIFMCRSRIIGEDKTVLIVHNLMIGNSATDTFYMITFESPEYKWEEADKISEIMLTNFALDDEI